MKDTRKDYKSPTIEKVLMDNDISLALASPWGDPAAFSAMEFSQDYTPMETMMPGL